MELSGYIDAHRESIRNMLPHFVDILSPKFTNICVYDMNETGSHLLLDFILKITSGQDGSCYQSRGRGKTSDGKHGNGAAHLGTV